MKHELPALPWAPEALEPRISRETIEYHHGKHHKAYVDKLNELIEGTEYANMPLDALLARLEGAGTRGALYNNAAQAWNHTFYFAALSPTPKAVSGALASKIDAAFGSFDAFREAFVKTGVGQFGSGWVWLIEREGKLAIEATANAARPAGKLLAVLDVWEHAYYIDYRNRRLDHLNAAFELIDWVVVEGRM